MLHKYWHLRDALSHGRAVQPFKCVQEGVHSRNNDMPAEHDHTSQIRKYD